MGPKICSCFNQHEWQISFARSVCMWVSLNVLVQLCVQTKSKGSFDSGCDAFYLHRSVIQLQDVVITAQWCRSLKRKSSISSVCKGRQQLRTACILIKFGSIISDAMMKNHQCMMQIYVGCCLICKQLKKIPLLLCFWSEHTFGLAERRLTFFYSH